MNKLQNVKDTVQKFAQVLMEVIKFDVEIVDSKLTRIAGTGGFEMLLGMQAEEGNIYKYVLELKKPVIVENPRNHELCKGCQKIGTCTELYEISYPIILDDQVLGVIGFLCYSQQQRDNFIKNRESLINFLQQIADLIAIKAKVYTENCELSDSLQILMMVINKVSECVLLIDKNGYLIDYNLAGAKFINYQKSSKIQFKALDMKKEGKQVYSVAIDGNTVPVYGEISEVRLAAGNYTIAIFDDVSSSTEKSGAISPLKDIVGESSNVKELKDKLGKIARNNSTVLVTGESGTGKELIARSIHNLSERSKMPFVAINCGAIPDALLESELFGYEKGAFTGADPRGKVGKFEIADGGTIFLDEIADMPLYMQVKILRVLQDRTFTKIGSNISQKVDVRVIAATNKDLQKMVQDRTFREDLFYRLNVIPVHSHPLRERKEDLKLLTQYFLNKYQVIFNKKMNKVEREVWDLFYRYDWPGNVRELENTIEFVVAMSDDNGNITVDTLPNSVKGDSGISAATKETYNLKQIENKAINEVMEICGYTAEGKQRAAGMLGIGIATLYRKLQ